MHDQAPGIDVVLPLDDREAHRREELRERAERRPVVRGVEDRLRDAREPHDASFGAREVEAALTRGVGLVPPPRDTHQLRRRVVLPGGRLLVGVQHDLDVVGRSVHTVDAHPARAVLARTRGQRVDDPLQHVVLDLRREIAFPLAAQVQAVAAVAEVIDPLDRVRLGEYLVALDGRQAVHEQLQHLEGTAYTYALELRIPRLVDPRPLASKQGADEIGRSEVFAERYPLPELRRALDGSAPALVEKLPFALARRVDRRIACRGLFPGADQIGELRRHLLRQPLDRGDAALDAADAAG